MTSLWILNGTLLTQDPHRRVLKAHLYLENGRIEKITPRTPKKIPKGTKKIDASGLVIAPGFVQSHVHLCQTLFRNLADDLELLDWLSKRIWPMEAAHTKRTLKLSALLGIHELLSSGTTCILDMATVRHTEVILETVKKTGIRANVGKCLMDHPTQTPENLREDTHSALNEAKALFEKWNGQANDRIRVSYAPRFVISCTETMLREVQKLAVEQGAIIHTHASENQKEIQVVQEQVGCDNIEYLHRLGLTQAHLVLAHCIWLKPHELQILKETQTNAVHCPSSNLKLASGIAKIPEMLKAGIRVSLGADGAPCNNNLNLFQEMRLAALIHKPGSGPRAMRAQEVYDLATLGGAQALGWEKDIGSIEIGKKADLIALDLHRPENFSLIQKPDSEQLSAAIVYSGQPSHVAWTMVDGRILYRAPRVLTVSLTDCLKEAEKSRRHFQAS